MPASLLLLFKRAADGALEITNVGNLVLAITEGQGSVEGEILSAGKQLPIVLGTDQVEAEVSPVGSQLPLLLGSPSVAADLPTENVDATGLQLPLFFGSPVVAEEGVSGGVWHRKVQLPRRQRRLPVLTIDISSGVRLRMHFGEPAVFAKPVLVPAAVQQEDSFEDEVAELLMAGVL